MTFRADTLRRASWSPDQGKWFDKFSATSGFFIKAVL